MTRHLGAALLRARKARGVSQDAVASEAGLSRTHYCRVELGAHRLRAVALPSLERFLEVEPGTFLRAAILDLDAIMMPVGLGARDDVLVELAVWWATLSDQQVGAIRAVLPERKDG